jgi:phytoene dehydrogenase-like protein
MSFDAVIVGGGNKALVMAMYLSKYGGMSVGMFERRHELGGGWASEDIAGGFVANTHATDAVQWYCWPLEQDFNWVEMGGAFYPHYGPIGGLFDTDPERCLSLYTPLEIDGEAIDPTQEKSAAEIARFSQRDGETWLWLWNKFQTYWVPNYLMEWIHNPPPLPGVPDPLERMVMDPKSEIDPSWLMKSPLEVFRDLFEDESHIVCTFLKIVNSWISLPPLLNGAGLTYLLILENWIITGHAKGGTHMWAHAANRICLENGVKSFTNKEVDKVIIENGAAKGIRCTDGTDIEAKKLVVSTLDPYTLCFRLIGKEHLDPRLLRRVAGISRDLTCICWANWALREEPKWRSASFNPDIQKNGWIVITNGDPLQQEKEVSYRRTGQFPPDDLYTWMTWRHTILDRTCAPIEGAHVMGIENFVLPANQLTEEEWAQFHVRNAETTIKRFQFHAPNFTWDNVIAYSPTSPYACTRLANMGPEGNWAVIDNIPSQVGRTRPVPDLAGYKTPIKNLYATGSAWPPVGCAHTQPAYNCYKVISEDYGLRKPWQEQGRPF